MTLRQATLLACRKGKIPDPTQLLTHFSLQDSDKSPWIRTANLRETLCYPEQFSNSPSRKTLHFTCKEYSLLSLQLQHAQNPPQLSSRVHALFGGPSQDISTQQGTQPHRQSLLQSSLVDCPRLYQIYRLSLFNTILLAFIFHECFSNKLFVLLTAPQFSASQRTQLICLCPVADTKTGHSSSESTPQDSIHIRQHLICHLRFTQQVHVKFQLRFKLELPLNEKCSTQLCVL